MNLPFNPMRRNLTVNDLSTDPEIVKALEAYDARVRDSKYEHRRRQCCDVCGNVPDEYGIIDHGDGCYTQSENGGGTSSVDLEPYPEMHKGCQCDLRDRQWDGHSKCLTCRRRYVDDRPLLQGYSGIHKDWDRLLAAVTPVADGAHAVADLGPDLSDDLAEHDSNGEA